MGLRAELNRMFDYQERQHTETCLDHNDPTGPLAYQCVCRQSSIDELKAKAQRMTALGHTAKLKRTFNMTLGNTTLKFWRIVGPSDFPNLNSDLSLEGLKDWGIVP